MLELQGRAGRPPPRPVGAAGPGHGGCGIDALRSPTLVLMLAGAVLIAATFLVPRAGPLLALALIAASVPAYGAQVRASGRRTITP